MTTKTAHNPYRILSAAHCWQGDGAVFSAYIGAFSLNPATDPVIKNPSSFGYSPEFRTAKRALMHPSYDSVTMEYDLMLLELDAPSNIAPIKVMNWPIIQTG